MAIQTMVYGFDLSLISICLSQSFYQKLVSEYFSKIFDLIARSRYQVATTHLLSSSTFSIPLCLMTFWTALFALPPVCS